MTRSRSSPFSGRLLAKCYAAIARVPCQLLTDRRLSVVERQKTAYQENHAAALLASMSLAATGHIEHQLPCTAWLYQGSKVPAKQTVHELAMSLK